MLDSNQKVVAELSCSSCDHGDFSIEKKKNINQTVPLNVQLTQCWRHNPNSQIGGWTVAQQGFGDSSCRDFMVDHACSSDGHIIEIGSDGRSKNRTEWSCPLLDRTQGSANKLEVPQWSGPRAKHRNQRDEHQHCDLCQNRRSSERQER